MATDTRRASANPSNAHHSSSPPALLPGTAERPYHGKIYETFTAPPSLSASPASSQRAFSPPENANAIPGGSTNTAGGLVREATMWDGIKSIKADDMRSLHKIPCVRDALLVGMGLGFTIGGARMILG
ncbi:hypothetical protein MMC13_000350, partial [Lambiella insularis]|nr:hypothetical protein [Lambiella insularis]